MVKQLVLKKLDNKKIGMPCESIHCLFFNYSEMYFSSKSKDKWYNIKQVIKMEENIKKETKKESVKIEILDFVRMILICFVFVFLCVKFVFRPVTVDGSSMYPTLEDKEFGFSNVFSTFVSDIKRFEVVVVYNEDITQSDKLWVKRVIGLPGEKIEFKDNILYIDDKEVKETFFDESYVKERTENGASLFTSDFGPYYLADDEYFLMGDNRQISKDSRSVGPFKKADIVSKYVIVLYPFSKFGIVSDGTK